MGEGGTEKAALEDLREALTRLIEELGIPRELSIAVAPKRLDFSWFRPSVSELSKSP
ncbi:hypothetical protein GCM10027456_56870 [Kineosporia babensis]